MANEPKVIVVGTYTEEHERRLQLVLWQVAKRLAREQRQRAESNEPSLPSQGDDQNQ